MSSMRVPHSSDGAKIGKEVDGSKIGVRSWLSADPGIGDVVIAVKCPGLPYNSPVGVCMGTEAVRANLPQDGDRLTVIRTCQCATFASSYSLLDLL